MERLKGALTLAILLLGGCTRSGSSDKARPLHPNVVLISLDTVRADRLNIYGYGRHPTSPVIDALSRDGIVHEAHIASSPWTTPSHLSLFTSLHPCSHGVMARIYSREIGEGEGATPYVRLSDSRVTLAEALAGAGYRTAAFTGGITLDPRIGFDQGFERYETTMYKLGPLQVQPMLDWIGAGTERPFFLFWHTFEVHAPYTRGRFLPRERAPLQLDLARLTEMITDGPPTFHSSVNEVNAELLDRHGARNLETSSDLYDGGVATADFWVGRLVEHLLTHDLYDSTLIVLTSDHGEELGDHDPNAFYDRHGHTNYEEMVRIPLVVKLPHSAHAGMRVGSVTSTVDVMPTVLDVVGVAAPTGQMQGESLTRLWEGGDGQDRLAFTEAAAFPPEVKSVRSARYKLILDIAPETVEEHGRSFVPEVPQRRRLFDLIADPREVNDLLKGSPTDEIEATAADLERRLRALACGTPGAVDEIEIDPEAFDRLKAMGYVR